MEAADDEGKTCVDYANALGDGDRELMLNVLTGSHTRELFIFITHCSECRWD